MHEPEIKALEMVRSIREAHYARVKDLSPREKIAFFREKARALHSELGVPGEPSDFPVPGQDAPARR